MNAKNQKKDKRCVTSNYGLTNYGIQLIMDKNKPSSCAQSHNRNISLLAIHTTDTRPAQQRGENFSQNDFELLCMILSALKWREKNGKIKLYTDSTALRFYEKHGLLDIWDGGIDYKSLESSSFNIDYETFWAAGKLISLCHESTPIVTIDTDMILWNELNHWKEKPNSCICIHKEELYEGVYLEPNILKTSANYQFDTTWDWNALPCNTAFVYHGNQKLLDYYLEEAFRFMHNNKEKPKEKVSQMVFAEQRLLAIAAKKLNVKVYAFYEYNQLSTQKDFTHLWGYKRELKTDKKLADNICKKIVNRLLNDFSDTHSFLIQIPVVQSYM